MTFHPDFLKSLHYLNKLQSAHSSDAPPPGEWVYAGNESYRYQQTNITAWNNL